MNQVACLIFASYQTSNLRCNKDVSLVATSQFTIFRTYILWNANDHKCKKCQKSFTFPALQRDAHSASASEGACLQTETIINTGKTPASLDTYG